MAGREGLEIGDTESPFQLRDSGILGFSELWLLSCSDSVQMHYTTAAGGKPLLLWVCLSSRKSTGRNIWDGEKRDKKVRRGKKRQKTREIKRGKAKSKERRRKERGGTKMAKREGETERHKAGEQVRERETGRDSDKNNTKHKQKRSNHSKERGNKKKKSLLLLHWITYFQLHFLR